MYNFTVSRLMMESIKSDLINHTFPHLLTHLAVGTKSFLEVALAEAARKTNGNAPSVQVVVEQIPTPGRAIVKAVFMASEQPVAGVHSLVEAEAYKLAFQTVVETHLTEEAYVSKLLADVGVQ